MFLLESTRRRPVLLIDEAQEMAPPVLSELRLMASARFDSQPLLCVVVAGDARLPEKLRRKDLVPLVRTFAPDWQPNMQARTSYWPASITCSPGPAMPV